MALRDHHGFDPFGWSVACSGFKPGQVRDEVRRMVDWATERWTSYFPRDQGYACVIESPAGPSNGVVLTVSRGDFRASVAIENILDPARKAPGALAVRMFGRANSDALVEAERSREIVVARCRTVGIGLGFGVFALLCWVSIGVRNPAFYLAGLLMVVAALMSMTALGGIGTWIGEAIAERGQARARAIAEGNPRLQDDLRRWRALVRLFAGQRHAIGGAEPGVPFRSLPAARSEPLAIPAKTGTTGPHGRARTTGRLAPVRVA
jgi:hypothetical protein